MWQLEGILRSGLMENELSWKSWLSLETEQSTDPAVANASTTSRFGKGCWAFFVSEGGSWREGALEEACRALVQVTKWQE